MVSLSASSKSYDETKGVARERMLKRHMMMQDDGGGKKKILSFSCVRSIVWLLSALRVAFTRCSSKLSMRGKLCATQATTWMRKI
jgi:hypothetical protein